MSDEPVPEAAEIAAIREAAAIVESSAIWRLIERRADATPEACFAIDDADRRMSFGGYRSACERAAAGLARAGVAADTVVSWMLPTMIESLVLAGALARLGALQNPILPIYREREVGFITRQARSRLLVVPRVFRGFDYAAMAAEVAEASAGLRTLVVEEGLPEGDPSTLPRWHSHGDGRPAPPEPGAALDPDPVRWLFYTSGTTADPKGALHTDRTLLVTGHGLCRVLDLRPDDRIALVFPFTHVGGMGWLLAGLISGAAQIVIPVFSPDSVEVLRRHGMTQGTAGTAFHQVYLDAQRAQRDVRVLPRARAFPGGGAPKPPQLHYEMKAELGGVGIVSGYELTECPIAAMNTVHDPDDKLANTEGRANPPELEIRIVTAAGERARPGQEGEIRLRGPQLCKGYLDPSLDADAFDADGFFRTGDLGSLDADGFLTITGRQKDVIIRNGENIPAKEVEDLLYRHPKVADVAVVGLPDPATGERACAVVVAAVPGQPLGFDEMVEFLRAEKLMVQKIPERLEHVPELPRNPTGKVLKHELRDRYAPSA